MPLWVDWLLSVRVSCHASDTSLCALAAMLCRLSIAGYPQGPALTLLMYHVAVSGHCCWLPYQLLQWHQGQRLHTPRVGGKQGTDEGGPAGNMRERQIRLKLPTADVAATGHNFYAMVFMLGALLLVSASAWG